MSHLGSRPGQCGACYREDGVVLSVLRHIGQYLIAERLGMALGRLGARPNLHTQVYRIPVAAWTVNHKIVNQCVQV